MAATIGKVRAVFTASTSGLTAGVNAASASMKGLRRDSQSLDSALTRLRTAGAAIGAIDTSGFNATATAAARATAAAQAFEQQASAIAASMQSGAITADQAAAAIGQLNAQAQQAAATFERGAQVIAANATAEQRFASTTSELNALLQAGAIDQGTFQRAVDAAQQSLNNATGVTQAQTQAMQEMAATFERGAQVTQSVQSAEERHAATLAELRSLLQAGAISQQTYGRAVDLANDKLRQSRPAANAAAGGMSTVSSAVSGVTSRLNALIAIQGTQLFGSLISGAANYGRQLAALVVSTAETVSSQNDLAGRLGVTYGELAGLGYAGSLVGVSMDTIGAAMTRAQVAFANAANGSKTATAAFARLGVSVGDLNGLTSQQQFEAIAQAISQLPTEAQRAAAAVQIFGRAGAQLLPLFAGGAEGIRQAREEAERFGLTLTNAQSGNIDAMGDSFDRAQAAITGVIQQIVAYLAPAIESVTTQFTNLIGGIGGANIGQAIGDGILQGARFLATVVDYFIANGTKVWQYASQIGGQWNAVWSFGQRVGSFLSGVWNIGKAVILSIVNVLSTTITKLAEVGSKIGSYLLFDTSSLDQFVETSRTFNQSIREGANQAADQAGRDFKAAFDTTETFNNAGEAIVGPATALIDSAIAEAERAASTVDQAAKQTVEVKQTVVIPVNEALKGIDSRSREGVAEMFRIMRGSGEDVQEQQLAALEKIAENTAGSDLEEPLVEFAFPGG